MRQGTTRTVLSQDPTDCFRLCLKTARGSNTAEFRHEAELNTLLLVLTQMWKTKKKVIFFSLFEVESRAGLFFGLISLVRIKCQKHLITARRGEEHGMFKYSRTG